MTTKTNSLEAWYAALTVGGRLNPEKSRARERKYYSDPANSVKFEGERRRGVQRDIDEVEVLLDLWADWMRRPEGPDEGKVAVGFMTGTLKDTDELYAAAHEEKMERVDAAYDSLAPLYKEAILRHYGLGARVWRFAKDATFEDAKTVIRVKFVKKGLL